MKYIAYLAIIGCAVGINIHGDDDLPEYDKTKVGQPDAEDEWLTVPKFEDKVADAHWGHEVQRVGHDDWLDGHVSEVKDIRAWVPPKPDKEDRRAIADS